MIPKVKICCINSIEEAQLAIRAGASALGLVAKMPSGPGPIEDELIREIARTIPPPIASFMLTSETSAEAIIAHHRRTLTNTIQFVDSIEESTYYEIRKELPAIKLVQVIHVIDETALEEALWISTVADAILLDSGNPHAPIKELGGTGRTHNWRISRQIVESFPIPVFLAGGLHAGNVRQAIDQVNPFGIDLCSGVRTDGKLDERKLNDFFKAISKSNL